MKLVNRPLNSKRTRYIDIEHRFVQDAVQAKSIYTIYILTEKQQANALTKALDRKTFEKHARLYIDKCGMMQYVALQRDAIKGCFGRSCSECGGPI